MHHLQSVDEASAKHSTRAEQALGIRCGDLVAMSVALVGVCLFAGIMAVMAFLDLAKQISNCMAKSNHRCFVLLFGLALILMTISWHRLGA